MPTCDLTDHDSWLIRTIILTIVLGLFATTAIGQNMKATIRHTSNDIPVRDLDNVAWKGAEEIKILTYWNGTEAPAGRRFRVKMLWSASALYVRFEAEQKEQLVVNEIPDLSKKTMRLWDRDVAEIFIAPDLNQPRKYFEFEVAPTGEWIDLAIDYTGPERKTDWDFKSGMESSAMIGENKVVMAIKIPWTTFGIRPKPGNVWLGNLFRCVGKDPTRGYLSWQPTMTEQPNFHVPDKFGKFEFKK